MAASVTATSVLPVPPKPELTVITPDFSDRSRIAAILWRRHSAVASRLAPSRLPRVNTSPRLEARLGTAPLAPSGAGAPPAEGGDDVAQAEPVKLNETSGGWIYPTGLLGLDGGAGLVDPHLGWQGRG